MGTCCSGYCYSTASLLYFVLYVDVQETGEGSLHDQDLGQIRNLLVSHLRAVVHLQGSLATYLADPRFHHLHGSYYSSSTGV